MNGSPSTFRRPTTPRRWGSFFAVLVLTVSLSSACSSKSIRPATNDSGVSTRVRTALLNDPQVSATNITVTSANGVVTLSGRVRTPAEADRAVAVARQTTGVTDVRSELAVAQP